MSEFICRLTKIFNRGKFGSNEHCAVQDNCIDNIFFFGGRNSFESSPSLQVNHLKLNNSSHQGKNDLSNWIKYCWYNHIIPFLTTFQFPYILFYTIDDSDGREMYITSDIPHMLRIDPNNLETLYKVCTINMYQFTYH